MADYNALLRMPDPGQTWMAGIQAGQQMRQQNALLQRQELAYQAHAQQLQEAQQAKAQRRQTGQLYASGDKEGARSAAVASGDFDLANTFLQLDEQMQKAAVAKSRAAAPVLLQAGKLPYQQRKALIAAAAPTLVAQGWKPEEIEAFDPTDEAINGMAASVMTLEQVLESGKVKWVTVPGVGAFATEESTGRPTRPGFAGDPLSGGQPAPQPSGAPVAPTAGQATGDFTTFHQNFLAPVEGGYAASDGRSGAPVNFGVNQKANPDIDVIRVRRDSSRSSDLSARPWSYP